MKTVLSLTAIILFLWSCNHKKFEASHTKFADSLLIIANDSRIPAKVRLYNNNLAKEAIIALPNCKAKRVTLFKILNRYYNLDDLEQYKILSHTVLINSREANDTAHVAKAYHYLGDYYQKCKYLNKSDSAYYFFVKAEKFYRSLNDLHKLVDVLLLKADILFFERDFYGSESVATEALVISEQIKYSKGTYMAYSFLGIISNELKDYDKALDLLTKSHKSLDLSKLEDFQAEILLNNIGNVLQNLGRQNLAISSFRKALRNPTLEVNNPALHAVLLDNLAYSKYKKGIVIGVETLFLQSINIRERLSQEAESVFSKSRLAEFYYSTGDSAIANNLLKNVVYSPHLTNRANKIPALEQLLLNNVSTSSNYATQFIKINDSLQIAERKLRNKFARIKYETEEIENEKEDAIKQKWIVLALAITAIIIIGLMLIIQIQRNRQKELKFIQMQQNANAEIYDLMHEQQNKIEDSREFEKKRIARELHDGIMNKLTSTRLNLFVLNKRTDSDTIKSCLPYIAGIQEIEKEIRVIAHDLNNSVFNNQDSFRIMINQLFRDYHKITDSLCDFEIEETVNWELFSVASKVHIYRILQELLQNINKHANAKNVKVIINSHLNQVLIQISDDGIGFASKVRRNGIGLSNVNMRVAAIKAKIDIRSNKSNGTIIRLKIPYVDDTCVI